MEITRTNKKHNYGCGGAASTELFQGMIKQSPAVSREAWQRAGRSHTHTQGRGAHRGSSMAHTWPGNNDFHSDGPSNPTLNFHFLPVGCVGDPGVRL